MTTRKLLPPNSKFSLLTVIDNACIIRGQSGKKCPFEKAHNKNYKTVNKEMQVQLQLQMTK